jgi:peptidase A4-like protein
MKHVFILIAVFGVACGSTASTATAAAYSSVTQHPLPVLTSMKVIGSGTVPASGGRVTVRATARHASNCTFQAAGLTPSYLSANCSSGSARMVLTFDANTRSVVRKSIVYVVAISASGWTSRWGHVLVTQLGAPTPSGQPAPLQPPSTTTPPPAATPSPAAIPSPNSTPPPAAPPPTIGTGLTRNWSGYQMTGGPFWGVKGTFNVPSLAAASSDTDTSEWVGIDGVLNTSLIQAGVDERYSAATNQFDVTAWWEILPAPAIDIPLPVTPGDQVTVVIGQAPGAQGPGQPWLIGITDETNGQQWATELPYSGPATSVEWVVEAPTSLLRGLESLGMYAPNVTFSDVGFGGTPGPITRLEMVQGGQVVSIPSVLSSGGFSVAYGSVAPPAP